MKASDFMRAVPAATRAKLPKKLQNFKVATRSWLVQLYYADPQLHYEVVTLGERRGILEIGLHFESRNSAINARLLDGMARHLIEIKAELGNSFEAERWDHGWTKIYATIPLETFDEAYVDRVATRLAQVIVVMQPILEEISSNA